MSNIPFTEATSEDPVERAIARKVNRILNDRSLDKQQRENLVKKAQRELVQHRRQVQQRKALSRQVATMHLPTGYQPQAILVEQGRIQLGALRKGDGFVWLDAGQAPKGVASNLSPFQLPGRPRASRGGARLDPIAQRRRELHR